jgi:hypothetical protein
MSKLSAILCLILLAGCAGALGAPAPPTSVPIEGPIREQAEEFKDLRTIEGHFNGADWNDDVDQWMGRKHSLMIELGEQLGGGAYSRSQAIDLLGDPDAIAREGDALYDQIRNRGEFKAPAGGGYEFLVYHWRGEHDLLYLTVREEAMLGAGWWYAGE